MPIYFRPYIFFQPRRRNLRAFYGRVAEQAYVEIVLRLEFVMFFDSVSRYADNFRIGSGKGGLLGGKINGLGRAAGVSSLG